MKKDIHPKSYKAVLFQDAGNGTQFLINSTIETKEKGVYEADGKEYPLVFVEITSASHPFYTGKDMVLDTAGRVDKFKKRREAASKKK